MDRLADLGTNQWNDLQEQMSRLVLAWQDGEPGDLTEFLPPPGDVVRALTLQELILTDLEQRCIRGHGELLEYYVAHYPELGSVDDLPARMLSEEYLIRRRYGQKPSLDSYQRRFPRQFSELEILLRNQPPPRPVSEPHALPLTPSGGPATMMNQQQQVLNGYKMLRRIGGGAFADVYEAEALGGVHVAIKVLRQPLTSEDAKRELDALDEIKHLRHTCLVQIHAFWVEEERLCVVMDLADCTLRERLNEFKKGAAQAVDVPGLPPRELFVYFQDAAEALDYLHSNNIVHRDVKPANILLFRPKQMRARPGAAEEFQARARLADFGLAKLIESQRADASGGGTPAYMAPEACHGRTNFLSDQYSLAASYAELRLGRPLFPHTSLLELTNAHLHETPDLVPLSPEEQKVILRALAKNPEERFPTCMQFASALDEVLPQTRRTSSKPLTVARYTLKRLLDNTIRGELWEAVAPDGTHVALTLIRNVPAALANEDVRTLQFLRGIEHRNLARIFDVFLVDKQDNVLPSHGQPIGNTPVTLCIVRELLSESLAKRVTRDDKGIIAKKELIGLMWQAADALDALRGPFDVEVAQAPEPAKRPSGWWPLSKEATPAPTADTVTVVHCAISPRTLLVDGSTLKVGDFGLVRLLHSSKGLLPGVETVLHGYVPPELYRQQAHANSDQYSLAVTYVELRTGRSPFQTTAPAALKELQQEGKVNLKRLPDAEREVIKRATALDPERRYPSCREMMAALEDACFPSINQPAPDKRPHVKKQPKPAEKAVFPAAPSPPPVATLPRPDSGDIVLPTLEARKETKKPSVAPDTDPKSQGVMATITGPSSNGDDDRLMATVAPGPQAREQVRKPALVKPEPPPAEKPKAKVQGRGETPVQEKPASGGVRRPGKRSKWSLGMKLAVTFLPLILVAGVGVGIPVLFPEVGEKIKALFGSGGTEVPDPFVNEQRVQKLIDAQKHAEAHRELQALKESKQLSAEAADKLQQRNIAAWLARAQAHADAERLEPAQEVLKELLAHTDHAPARDLQQVVQRKIQLVKLEDEARTAIDRKDRATALARIADIEQIPEGKTRASELRKLVPRAEDPIPPPNVALLVQQLRQKEGKDALELVKKIKHADPKNAEAALHEEVLTAIEKMAGGAPPPSASVGSWIARLNTNEGALRLGEWFAAAATFADDHPGSRGAVLLNLPEPEKVPADGRAHLRYLRALHARDQKDPTAAAKEISPVLASKQDAARVITTDKRRVTVAGLLVDAATALRVPDDLSQVFRGGREAAETVHGWLTQANQFLHEAKQPVPAELEYQWVAAAWHRKESAPTGAEKEQVRTLANGLMARRKDLASRLPFDMSFLLVHAQSQNRADAPDRSAAVRSYAEALERVTRKDAATPVTPEVLYSAVFLDAMKLLRQPELADPAKEDRPAAAAIWAAYARLLQSNLKAYWLSPEKAKSDMLEAFERAVKLDRKPPVVVDHLRAQLDHTTSVLSEDDHARADWLVGQLPKSMAAYALLARTLERDVDNLSASDKQLPVLVRLRDTVRVGLKVGDEPGATAEDRIALTAAREKVEQVTKEITARAYGLLRAKEFKTAVELADKFKDLELVTAARVAGLAYIQQQNRIQASREYRSALKEANTPGNEVHIVFRQEYIEVLTHLDRGENKKSRPTAGELTDQAKLLVSLVTAEVEDRCRGMALGASGLAVIYAAAKVESKLDRKHLMRLAADLLEKGIEYAPEHWESCYWCRSLADCAVYLHDPANPKTVRRSEEALKLLKEAIKEGTKSYERLKSDNLLVDTQQLRDDLEKLLKPK